MCGWVAMWGGGKFWARCVASGGCSGLLTTVGQILNNPSANEMSGGGGREGAGQEALLPLSMRRPARRCEMGGVDVGWRQVLTPASPVRGDGYGGACE